MRIVAHNVKGQPNAAPWQRSKLSEYIMKTTQTHTTDLLQVPNAPQLPGLSFRRFRRASDLPKMLVVADAANQADQIDEKETLEELTHYYDHLKNCDPVRDMLMAEVDGELVAYSRVWWEQDQQGTYLYRHFGVVHPRWRGKGLGTAMLAYNQSRLLEVARQNDHPPQVPRFFESWGGDTMPDNHAILTKAGYQVVRYFFEMVRPLDQPIPEAPLPSGLEVRPFQEDHNRLIFDASSEAFRDHWSYIEPTEQDYQRWLNRPNRTPHLWQVAWDGDQVAGMVLNTIFPEENAAFNRKRGWTDPISVRRPWRRRGLARALLVRSMRMFKEMGYEDTALGVDTENPSGALRLYQGVGYQTVKTWKSYRKPLG